MGADLTPHEVAELRQSQPVELIDVREQDEWEAGRLAGARHIPLAELVEASGTITRDRTVVFYCRTGARSAMATEAFAGAGFDAHNMAGGLKEWEAVGLPLEPDGGHVA